MRKFKILLKLSIWVSLFVIYPISTFAENYVKQINYEITPLIGKDSPKIKIVVSFKGDKSGLTKIKLPLEFAGQEKLYQAIKNLNLLTPDAKMSETDKPEIKVINHLPNKELKFEYELVQDWAGVPEAGGAIGNAGGGYRPIIQKEYFHFLGSGGWVLPDVSESEKIKVSIVWKNIQPDFVVANSFGTKKLKQNFSTDVGAFLSSVFVGGDYQINQRLVKGKPVFIAARGKWNFTNDEFADLIEKIVSVEREFWRDHNHPYFLVTLLPIEVKTKSLSIGGTGLTNSFATFITTNVNLNDVKFLITHEYFHNWNTIAFNGMKEPEQLLYWFSEGFTDYYAYRLLLRSGLVNLNDFTKQYNDFLSEYYLSAVRNEDNQRVLRDFFNDYSINKLPYRRGFLLATKWDRIIRLQSNDAKSLDDVMRNILQDSQKHVFEKLSKEYLISVLSKYAKYDFAGDIEKYAERGETIGEFDGVLGNCVDYTEKQSGKFEVGFDFEAARKNKIVSKVVKDSAAYNLGLRDGQKILSTSIYFGNTSKEAEITVIENGEQKKISYLPETKEKITVPQFKLKANLSDNAMKECLSKF